MTAIHHIDTAGASWTDDPFAAVILEDCAANPPKCEIRRQQYAINADEWHVYVGKRPDRLTAIWSAYHDAAYAEYERTGDYAPVRQCCDQPNVTQAIDEALDKAFYARGHVCPDQYDRLPVETRVNVLCEVAGRVGK